MRKILLCSAAVATVMAAALSGCQSGYEYQTVENDPMNVKIYTLPNGLQVHMTVNKDQPRIHTSIAVHVGSKNDPADNTGLAHMLQHLMYNGTTQYGTVDYEAERPLLDQISDLYEIYRTKTDPEERKAIYHQIDQVNIEASKYVIPNEYDKMMNMIDAVGSNSYVDEDVTCFMEDIPSNQIENWAKIQSDRFMNPVFRNFPALLQSIYKEKNATQAIDSRREVQAIELALMPNHPYGLHTFVGNVDHIKIPSLVEIRKYYDTWYVPNNTAICLSGDFDPDNMIEILTRYFGHWRASDHLPDLNLPAFEPLKENVTVEVQGQEDENVMIAWFFPGAAKEEAEIMQFISSVLSNGKIGLFDQNLVQKQKVMDAGSYVDCRTDASTLYVYATPLPGQKLEEVRDLLLHQIQLLSTAEFEQELVYSVANDIKLGLERKLQTNEDRVALLTDAYAYGRSMEGSVTVLDRIGRINKMNLAKFACLHMVDQPHVVAFKRQCDAPLPPVIELPELSPVKYNNEAISPFAEIIRNSHVKPIEPIFVDFERDMQHGELRQGQPFYYKKNEINTLFELYYVYDMGRWSDQILPLVAHFADYLGTDLMTPDGVKEAYYRLGCEYKLFATNRRCYARITGLDENLAAAIALTEQVMVDAKADTSSFRKLMTNVFEQRNKALNNHRRVSKQLSSYAACGPEYIKSVNVSREELRKLKETDLTDRLNASGDVKYTVLYYGPRPMEEVEDMCNMLHKTKGALKDLKFDAYYNKRLPSLNVFYFTPFPSRKSTVYLNTAFGDGYDHKLTPAVALYNAYISQVFQEMRVKNGLNYNVCAHLTEPDFERGVYSFSAQITAQPESMSIAVANYRDMLNNMPISDTALSLAKEAILDHLRTDRTTGCSVLWAYLNANDIGLKEDPDKLVFEQVQNMTMQDLLDFQQKYIKGRKYYSSLVADPKLVDLEPFEKDGKVVKVPVEELFGW